MAGKHDRRIKRIWLRYRRTRSSALRTVLIEQYVGLVDHLARRVGRNLPGAVEIDDLRTAGVLGLMQAIESYDVWREVRFETFAAPRIRGAIIDELRTLDWVPRLVRSRARKLADATATLRAHLGRTPTHDELAAELHLSPDRLAMIVKDARPAGIISLSGSGGDDESQHEYMSFTLLPDKRAIDPQRHAQAAALREMMQRGLSRHERLVVMLSYCEELSMKEIGAVLGLSEARICQIRSNVMARLRARFAKDPAEAAA